MANISFWESRSGFLDSESCRISCDWCWRSHYFLWNKRMTLIVLKVESSTWKYLIIIVSTCSSCKNLESSRTPALCGSGNRRIIKKIFIFFGFGINVLKILRQTCAFELMPKYFQQVFLDVIHWDLWTITCIIFCAVLSQT